ncbi:MAG: type II toxin-antitoxin system RelE/ParE family toxin [Planctomycetaceae bacterium]
MTTKAERELNKAADWWEHHRSVDEAQRWYNGIVAAIQSLETNPDRCCIAREDTDIHIPLRELHFGLGRRPTHRVVFTIRPGRVIIHAVRHYAQRDLTEDDL